MDIAEIVQAQRDFFNSQATKDVAFRIAALRHLQSSIQQNQQKIFNALKTDLKQIGI